MLRMLASIFLAAVCGSAFATTGVALVHGTGKQTDAYNDYWQAGMVNSIRQGLPDQSNYVVTNCDFNQYMWTSAAAGCLATQLYNFITTKHIDDLVVITHSNGGNVMRWIMSNPTYDSRYPTIIKAIRWVNALAPSSAGTPLANAVIAGNVFDTSLGWLLGYQSDAVRQQQTSWMAYYNANNLYGTSGRPALPKGFWDVVGTDVISSPFNSDSYCGGYTLNVGSKSRRRGWRAAPTVSSNARVRLQPGASGSMTTTLWAARFFRTTRAGVSASAWMSCCATISERRNP